MGSLGVLAGVESKIKQCLAGWRLRGEDLHNQKEIGEGEVGRQRQLFCFKVGDEARELWLGVV